MSSIFLGGSLIAAFFAGVIALFAPCCIVFMFPSYLSVAVKNRRQRLVPLTFVFAAGVSVVLLPVTLGVSALSRSLLQFHGPLYATGGTLLLGLALLAVTGKTWMLPMMKQSPDVTRTDSGGVFALGIFSGAASACCAPVLAGVMTLSAVSPNLLQSSTMGLAYVFGMVFPLVLLTALWDRAGLADRPKLRGRVVRWNLRSKTFITNTLDLIAAAMFAIMGILLWVIAVTGTSVNVAFQDRLSVWLQSKFSPIVEVLDPIPELITGLALVTISVGAIVFTGRRRPLIDTPKEGDHDVESTQDQTTESCH